jgi:CheY-like chemotaxis protein
MSDIAPYRTILMADDDGEDCALVGDALREINSSHRLRVVHNGEELFDYLRRQGEFADSDRSPRPDLILLDLKMPCKDGRETLRELKADPDWRSIPVIVFTTSTANDDVEICYQLGVNSYVNKPSSFRGLVETMALLTKYWFEMALLPPKMRYVR